MAQVGTSWSVWNKWNKEKRVSRSTWNKRNKNKGVFRSTWNNWNKDKGSVQLNLSTCGKVGLQGRELVYTLEVGLGISQTNADSQWNPVYNAFHPNFCCRNETIRRYFCTRDLDAENLWPALEQGCGKQTPCARNLFFRANLLYVLNVKM